MEGESWALSDRNSCNYIQEKEYKFRVAAVVRDIATNKFRLISETSTKSFILRATTDTSTHVCYSKCNNSEMVFSSRPYYNNKAIVNLSETNIRLPSSACDIDIEASAQLLLFVKNH